MIAALIVLGIILIVIAGAYFFYRLTFYSYSKKKFTAQDYYHNPATADYRELADRLLTDMIERPFERVSVTSFDGLKLSARYYHRDDRAPYALLMNTFRGDAVGDYCGVYTVFEELGYNVLLADERSSGGSEGRLVTFGICERRDCLSWINYIIERFGAAADICVMGMSMGGAAVLMSQDLGLPENVKAIIDDCGFSSPKAQLKYEAAKRKLPVGLTYALLRLGCLIFGHFDISGSSALAAVKGSRIPTLIIHGEEDKLVPYQMGKDLFEACASEKEMLSVPGAAHTCSFYRDPEKYKETVINFLNEYMNRRNQI